MKTKAKNPNTAGPNSTQRTRGTGHPASTSSTSGTTTRDLPPHYQDHLHDNQANPHSYRYTLKRNLRSGSQRVDPNSVGAQSREAPRRAERPRSSHLFLIFVYQPEHKAAIDGNTLNGTGHTATEADVR